MFQLTSYNNNLVRLILIDIFCCYRAHTYNAGYKIYLNDVNALSETL